MLWIELMTRRQDMIFSPTYPSWKSTECPSVNHEPWLHNISRNWPLTLAAIERFPLLFFVCSLVRGRGDGFGSRTQWKILGRWLSAVRRLTEPTTSRMNIHSSGGGHHHATPKYVFRQHIPFPWSNRFYGPFIDTYGRLWCYLPICDINCYGHHLSFIFSS